MPRTFAYARVSTLDQDPQNQLGEIAAAGFSVEPHRVVTETISGSMSIEQRKGFTRLLDKMERGDVLVVTKLDRSRPETSRGNAYGSLIAPYFAVLSVTGVVN